MKIRLSELNNMNNWRILILGLLATLTLNNCANEIKENDWVEDKLKSKVLSYKETSFSAKDSFNIISKGERKRESFNSDYEKRYNEKGNIIEVSNYDSNGLLNQKSKYEYNKLDLLTVKKEYSSDGSLNTIISYKYGDNKTMTEWDNGENGTVCKLHYNENGDIEKNWYLDGDLYSKYLFKYDKNGNEVEIISYSEDNKIDNSWNLKYNELEYIVEKQRYDKDNNLIREIKYKYDYDKNNNWIKRIDFVDNFPLYVLEREYEYYK
ncbi:hypothetical protein [Winogradskyella costae]|uniref:hypothetical protein n=1 Tax=Winogradskyella costae TaxID=2697008 RepID=UPI0015C96647|nr:hypothetical protein [Winogradskyella costae]